MISTSNYLGKTDCLLTNRVDWSSQVHRRIRNSFPASIYFIRLPLHLSVGGYSSIRLQVTQCKKHGFNPGITSELFIPSIYWDNYRRFVCCRSHHSGYCRFRTLKDIALLITQLPVVCLVYSFLVNHESPTLN